MSRALTLALRLRGGRARRAFDRAAQDPRLAQEEVLRRILTRNRATAFGREHGFRQIGSAAEFARRVPVRDYEGHRPWIDGSAGESTACSRATSR